MDGIITPIGTEPWKLQTSKLNQYDILLRNDRYWCKKLALEKITIKVIPDPTSHAVAFEAGDIELLYRNEGLLPPEIFTTI